jgi:hypothetical protein
LNEKRRPKEKQTFDNGKLRSFRKKLKKHKERWKLVLERPSIKNGVQKQSAR